MKQNKKNSLFSLFGLLLILQLFVFSACDSTSKEVEHQYDPNKPVKVDDFSPTEGMIATPVILRGDNFGGDVKNVKVYFNNNEAFVASAKGNRLFVVTPKCTYEDTCYISVVIGKDSVTYTKPYIYETTANVSTVAGGSRTAEDTFDESNLALAQFNREVEGICIDKNDDVFITSSVYIFRISEKNNLVKKLYDIDGGFLSWMKAIITDVNKEVIYSAFSLHNKHFLIFDPINDYEVTSRDLIDVSTGPQKIDGQFRYAMAACPVDNNIYCMVVTTNLMYKLDPVSFKGEVIETASTIPFTGDCDGMTFHPEHPEMMYLSSNGRHCIYTYNVLTRQFKLVAGIPGQAGHWDAEAGSALFNTPRGITFDSNGDLFIVDGNNHCIRKLNLTTNQVTTVAGQPGVAGYNDGKADEDAMFYHPYGIAVNSKDILYITETENRSVRRLAIE